MSINTTYLASPFSQKELLARRLFRTLALFLVAWIIMLILGAGVLPFLWAPSYWQTLGFLYVARLLQRQTFLEDLLVEVPKR